MLLSATLNFKYDKSSTESNDQLNLFYKYAFQINDNIYYENLNIINTNERLLIMKISYLKHNNEIIYHFDGIQQLINNLNLKQKFDQILSNLFYDFIINQVLCLNEHFINTFNSIIKCLKQIFINNYNEKVVEMVIFLIYLLSFYLVKIFLFFTFFFNRNLLNFYL